MSWKVACEAVFAVIMFCYATAFAVTWKDCGSELGTPTNVFVQNCPDAGKCVLHKGVNMSFGVDFTSKEDASGIKMLVYGHIAGVDIPFPLENPNACKDSNITCPIRKDQAYGYRNVIYVKSSYPSISVVVKLKIVDQSGGVLVCVVIPVELEAVVHRKPDQTLRFVRMH